MFWVCINFMPQNWTKSDAEADTDADAGPVCLSVRMLVDMLCVLCWSHPKYFKFSLKFLVASSTHLQHPHSFQEVKLHYSSGPFSFFRLLLFSFVLLLSESVCLKRILVLRVEPRFWWARVEPHARWRSDTKLPPRHDQNRYTLRSTKMLQHHYYNNYNDN